jgi:hypothetical protein
MPAETKDHARIELTHAEALEVGAMLKISSRAASSLADTCREEGHTDLAAKLKARAALFDSVSDRIYLPFIGKDGIDQLSAQIDHQ